MHGDTQYEFASVLRFIETRFGLTALGDRDSTANDTLDSFDFKQTPLPSLILSPRNCPVVPPGVNLGYQAVGAKSAPVSVYMTNSSAVPITTLGVTATGDFSVTATCATIPVNTVC